jgi:hypothetical protein
VIAVDTNVLVYAHRREPTEHAAAFDLIGALAHSPERWAIPWPCIYEFYSIVTNPRIWKSAASTPAQAWSQLSVWFGAPGLQLIGETEDFASILARFARRPRVRGPIIHDARVAAICVAHGVERLLTRDRDFALFPELRTANPFG